MSVPASCFFLGVHQPAWMRFVEVPVFVSHTRLKRYKRLPVRAEGRIWACDSGAFSEIARHGRFTTSPSEYGAALGRYREEIGGLAWAAPQDMMCESFVLARTGLDVREHQRRSIASVQRLRAMDHGVHVIPVLQGNTLTSYLDCARGYEAAGIALAEEPVVGLGSVCRRQSTREIGEIVTALARDLGLRLHGFGVKTLGLARYGEYLTSSDSMAWSAAGRRVSGCAHGRPVKSESNCLPYALEWRKRVLDQAPQLASAGGGRR